MSESVASFRGGWVLGRGTTTMIVPSSGNYGVLISVPSLRLISWVLEWTFESMPIVSHGTVENVRVSGNVVGCTILGVGGGTTLTAEVVVFGQ